MNPVRAGVFALVASLALVLSACGGGGGGGSTSVVPTTPATLLPTSAPTTAQPSNAPHSTPTPPGSTPTPKPSGAPSTGPSTAPTTGPTSAPTSHATPTPVPTASPIASSTFYPADVPSKFRSSYGRIGLSQIFDYFPYYPGYSNSMSSAQISADASRYDSVWGSFTPQPWRSSNPQAYVSRYYIISEDNELVSGHNLQWWQQNHPDWILYACDSSGNPTHDYAYTPGDGFPDVPLDIHNPAVVQYQIQQSLLPYATANGYNTLALDEVIFTDYMLGGNPELGQTEKSGEYGCGIYNQDGTFTKIYNGASDPTWASDVLNWVEQAHAAASAQGLAVIANHPQGGSTYAGNSNEVTLFQNIDATVDESGFSGYGSGGNFSSVYKYAEWVESQGKEFIVIDRYANGSEQEPTSPQVEYGIATYLMANEGNEELYINANTGTGYGYGTEQYHQEYATPIGQPCNAMTEDSVNTSIYYRRFSGGLVVVNGSLNTAQNATLPANHAYTDIEGRPVTNPLTVQPFDGYVLTTTNGCS